MYKKLFLIFPFLTYSLCAQDVLNKTQSEFLKTKKDIAKNESTINKFDWISDINLNFSSKKDNNDEKTDSFSASFEQKIFNFGDIPYTIDLSKVQKLYDLLDVDITYDEYLNKVYSTVVNLKINFYEIKQKELEIKNKEISIAIKKDEYKQGQIGISDLNDEIIDKSTLQESLVTLKKQKKIYLSTLKQYSNIDYEKIEIPTLKILSVKDYLKSSKKLKEAKINIKIKKLEHKIEKTNYLPSLSLTSNYNNDYTENEDSYNYGLKLSMPIDFFARTKTQKTQLAYLLAKKEKNQEYLEQKTKYKEIISTIESYEENKKISLKDIKLYTQLLETTKQEYDAGYKAIEDVQTLENTKKIRELDYKIDDLNIQNEIISLYFYSS